MKALKFAATLALCLQVGCNANTPLPPKISVVIVASPTSKAKQQIYRGVDTSLRRYAFEVAYDEATWMFLEKDVIGREGVLQSRADKNCWIWLNAGGLGLEPLNSVLLTNGEWKRGKVRSNILQYAQEYREIAFHFGVVLPEPFVQNEPSPCLQMSEDVLKTFRVVEKT